MHVESENSKSEVQVSRAVGVAVARSRTATNVGVIVAQTFILPLKNETKMQRYVFFSQDIEISNYFLKYCRSFVRYCLQQPPSILKAFKR